MINIQLLQTIWHSFFFILLLNTLKSLLLSLIKIKHLLALAPAILANKINSFLFAMLTIKNRKNTPHISLLTSSLHTPEFPSFFSNRKQNIRAPLQLSQLRFLRSSHSCANKISCLILNHKIRNLINNLQHLLIQIKFININSFIHQTLFKLKPQISQKRLATLLTQNNIFNCHLMFNT